MSHVTSLNPRQIRIAREAVQYGAGAVVEKDAGDGTVFGEDEVNEVVHLLSQGYVGTAPIDIEAPDLPTPGGPDDPTRGRRFDISNHFEELASALAERPRAERTMGVEPLDVRHERKADGSQRIFVKSSEGGLISNELRFIIDTLDEHEERGGPVLVAEVSNNGLEIRVS